MGCALTLHVISPQSKITHRVHITGTKDTFNFSLYLQQPPETSHPSPVMSNRHAPCPSVSSSSPDPLVACAILVITDPLIAPPPTFTLRIQPLQHRRIHHLRPSHPLWQVPALRPPHLYVLCTTPSLRSVRPASSHETPPLRNTILQKGPPLFAPTSYSRGT
jgi:hypothetical protein